MFLTKKYSEIDVSIIEFIILFLNKKSLQMIIFWHLIQIKNVMCIFYMYLYAIYKHHQIII